MSIKSVTDIVEQSAIGMYHRLFKVASPTRILNFYFMSLYLSNGTITLCSLLEKIVNYAYSAMELLFDQPSKKYIYIYIFGQDGYVGCKCDSFISENFI